MFGQFGIVSPIHKDKTKRPHGSSVQPKPGFGISNFGISIGAEIFKREKASAPASSDRFFVAVIKSKSATLYPKSTPTHSEPNPKASPQLPKNSKRYPKDIPKNSKTIPKDSPKNSK